MHTPLYNLNVESAYDCNPHNNPYNIYKIMNNLKISTTILCNWRVSAHLK